MTQKNINFLITTIVIIFIFFIFFISLNKKNIYTNEEIKIKNIESFKTKEKAIIRKNQEIKGVFQDELKLTDILVPIAEKAAAEVYLRSIGANVPFSFTGNQTTVPNLADK